MKFNYKCIFIYFILLPCIIYAIYKITKTLFLVETDDSNNLINKSKNLSTICKKYLKSIAFYPIWRLCLISSVLGSLLFLPCLYLIFNISKIKIPINIYILLSIIIFLILFICTYKLLLHFQYHYVIYN